MILIGGGMYWIEVIKWILYVDDEFVYEVEKYLSIFNEICKCFGLILFFKKIRM